MTDEERGEAVRGVRAVFNWYAPNVAGIDTSTSTSTSVVEPPPESVKFLHGNDGKMEQRASIKEALEPWVEKFGPISVLNCHADRYNPKKDDGYFKIVFWPNFDTLGQTYDEPMFDYELHEGQWDGRRIPGYVFEEQKLFCPEGYPVAWLEGDTLFIPFDLPHESEQAAGPVLNEIMKLIGKEEDLGKTVAEKLHTISLRGIDSRVRALKSQLERRESEIRSYEQGLARTLSALTADKLTIEALEKHKDSTKEFIATQVENIKKLDTVTKVTVNPAGRLVISTKTLDFTFDKDLFEGSRYNIILNPRTGALAIKALDRLGKRYAHPHVKGTGDACLGTAGQLLREMFTRLDYFGIASLMIEFLQHSTVGDCYHRPYRERYDDDPEGWKLKKKYVKPKCKTTEEK